MADIGIYGKLVSRTSEGVLAAAAQVYDESYPQGESSGADQQTINAQLMAVLDLVSQLQVRVSALEGAGSAGFGNVINVSAGDRETKHTLATAIAAIGGQPPYGALLMYVDESDQWSMRQFTGTDYTDEGDWTTVGVSLTIGHIFVNANGEPADVGIEASDDTVWRVD